MAPRNLAAMCIGVVYTVATGIHLHGGPACAMRQSMRPLRAEIALPTTVALELASSNDAEPQPKWVQPTSELTKQVSRPRHESRPGGRSWGDAYENGRAGHKYGPTYPRVSADLEPPFEISDAAVHGFAPTQVQAAFDADLGAQGDNGTVHVLLQSPAPAPRKPPPSTLPHLQPLLNHPMQPRRLQRPLQA